MRTPRRASALPRRGYTLIEVLVTLALLVVLAVILVPALGRERAAERVERADTELKALTDAADAFADDVLEWPSSLSQLVSPLGAGETDVCGATYSNGERGRWAGPYLSRTVAAGGLPVGIGTVAPALTVVPAGAIAYLVLTIPEAEPGDARSLDARVDGDGDPGTGTVRWTAAAGGQVTVSWMIPIEAC